ncbi:shieldin complex subunit 2-like [Ptychodera flava]|uniref:shieldin complex subunit 2-like n=1 Tax=Ptychodera flava TaxID=63121 RepID=UPI00396A8978
MSDRAQSSLCAPTEKRLLLFMGPPSHCIGNTLEPTKHRNNEHPAESPWKKQKFSIKKGLICEDNQHSNRADSAMIRDGTALSDERNDDDDIDSALLQQSIHTYMDLTFLNSIPEANSAVDDSEKSQRDNPDSTTCKSDSEMGIDQRIKKVPPSLPPENCGCHSESSVSCHSYAVESMALQTQFDLVEISSQKLLAKYGLVADSQCSSIDSGTEVANSVHLCSHSKNSEHTSRRKEDDDEEEEEESTTEKDVGERKHINTGLCNVSQDQGHCQTLKTTLASKSTSCEIATNDSASWFDQTKERQVLNEPWKAISGYFKGSSSKSEKSALQNQRNISAPVHPGSNRTIDIFPGDLTKKTAKQRLTIKSLAECNKKTKYCNICVAVLQALPSKEVLVKSGINAGQYVSLASLQVADWTKEWVKVTLWRRAADLVEYVQPGDIVIFKDVSVDMWRGEYFCQTTYKTTVINSVQRELMSAAIDMSYHAKLLAWMKQHHPYLLSVRKPNRNKIPQSHVGFVPISKVEVDSIVHVKAKVSRIVSLTDTALYNYQGQEQSKVVIVLEDNKNTIDLTLWGNAWHWKSKIEKSVGHFCRFYLLQVKYSPAKGCLEFHTTPNSRYEVCSLLEDNQTDQTTQPISPSSIREIIVSKFTGLAQVNVKVKNIRLTALDGTCLQVSDSDSAEDLVKMLSRTQYTGCKHCKAQLTQDANGIFTMCSQCVPAVNCTESSLSQCFRTMVFNIVQEDYSLDCEVSPTCISKEILGFVSSNLKFTVSSDGVTSSKLCTERLAQFCFHILQPSTHMRCILHCYTSLDENSVALERSFRLHKVINIQEPSNM